MSFAIVVILLLTTTTLLINIPATDATLPPVVQSRAFLDVVPNPTGVNQMVGVTAMIQPFPPGDHYLLHNLTIKITKPDGSIETRGPYDSNPVAAYYFTYTPSQVGTYKFQFFYGGETIIATVSGNPVGNYTYLPAISPVTELIVQQERVEDFPENALPADYWTRPISPENRQWSTISGNWLMESYNRTYRAWDSSRGFNPYSEAPRTAHIAWIKELDFGGIVGGEFGTTSYYGGMTYENKLMPPIIMNGRLYYNTRLGSSGFNGFTCVDLRTGETIWTQKSSYTLTLGQLYNYISGNQMGVIPYLWSLGSTYKMFDAFTGEEITTFANATNGVPVLGEDGTLYVYIVDSQRGWVCKWNSTKAFENQSPSMISLSGTGVGRWRPVVGTFDWRKGIEFNQTVPKVNATIDGIVRYATVRDITANTLVCTVGVDQESKLEVGYDMTTGQQKWLIESIDYLPGYYHVSGEGRFFSWDPVAMTWVAYDATTGDKLWVSEPLDYPWGTYTAQPIVAYNKLYVPAYDGCIHAFDITNGKRIWKFYSGDAGTETFYGTYPFQYGPIVAGGVLFAGNGEHSPTQPLIRGERLFAMDAYTGEHIWNIKGMFPIDAIADGYLISYNVYDNRLYSFGKGPTKLTVSAPQTLIPEGNGVMITGTITDQSAGQKDTPAISDEDMSAWMEYLHMQKPKPQNAKGVQIMLTAIDSQGNLHNIGTTTSDTGGSYGKIWTPPTEGTYQIIATFEGSESYGSSYATTYLGVSKSEASISPTPATPSPTQTINPTTSTSPTAPHTSPTPASPTPAPQPASDMSFTTYIAVAAAAIIAAVVAAALLLRRRTK